MAAALIFVPGAQPISDRAGNTCVGELYFYTNDGTYTPKAVYTSSALTTPHPHPVVSDASGVFPAMYADSAEFFTVTLNTREADPFPRTFKDLQAAQVVTVGATGPAPNLAIGTVSSGSTAAATITGTSPDYSLNFVLQPGATGPAPNFTIGTVAGGASAAATITGTNPNYSLNLTLPYGAPSNLTMGTVTTLPAGSSATAVLTGTAPDYTLALGLPQGAAGTGNMSSTGTIAANDIAVFVDANTVKAGVPATILTTIGGVSKAGDTMTGTLVLAGNPTNALDAASKGYVDAVSSGLNTKASVKAATTANITLSGTQTIDGVSVVAGNRVLVKSQTTQSQNGIYVAATGAWSRSTDADAWSELVSAFTFIEQGTVNGDTGWVCAVDAGGTLGTTAVTWTQFSSAGVPTAGNGLTQTGLVFAIDASAASDIRTGTSTAKVVTPKSLYDASAFMSLTDASTIAVDLATFLNAKVTIGGNRTLGAPSNAKEGQSGVIKVTQDGTGSRTLAYNSAYKFAGGAPTLSTAAGAVDMITYIVDDAATPILRCTFAKAFA